MPVEKIYEQLDPVFPVMIPNLNGDLDGQYLVELTGELTRPGGEAALLVVPNGITGLGIGSTRYRGRSSATGMYVENTNQEGFLVALSHYSSDKALFFALCKIMARSGIKRVAFSDSVTVNASNGERFVWVGASVWEDITTRIDSLLIKLPPDTTAANCRLVVWRVN